MIKAVIIDDEISSRETLNIMLEMYAPDIKIIAEADGVRSGINIINELNPELVFLDIHMGDGSGFDLLNNFQSNNFRVIFVTAYEEYAIKAFKFSALDYLVKPVTPDDLVLAVKKMELAQDKEIWQEQLQVLESNYATANQSFGKIILKTADAIHIVEISDIIYCKSENNYTYIYLMGENKLVVSRTLKEFDELLGDVSFLRVHQSYLINSNQIDYFDKKEGGAVVMKNGNKIPVSFRKKEQLLQLIQKLGRQL